MTHLVIGLGQIGTAVSTVLMENETNEVEGIDIRTPNTPQYPAYDFLHICFPCSDPKRFALEVDFYQRSYADENTVTIIHSTVPVGTTRLCNARTVHSPVRGVHPNLVPGIKAFTKYFGGVSWGAVEPAAKVFSELGIKTKWTDKPENTEALKLWDTTIYGVNIILEKEIYDYCVKNGLDWALVYRNAREDYNEGFGKLGDLRFRQYALDHMEGKIGGHCVVPNAKLIGHWIGDMITDWQEKRDGQDS